MLIFVVYAQKSQEKFADQSSLEGLHCSIFCYFLNSVLIENMVKKLQFFFTSSVNSGHVTMTSQKSTFKQSVLYARATTLHKKQVSLVFHAKFDTNCENWCLHLIVFFSFIIVFFMSPV